jgi:hypothetical protein
VRGRGGFEEEMEDGCGRMTDARMLPSLGSVGIQLGTCK